MRFTYTRFRGGSAPIIPIQVRGRHRWHKVWVYVDSGASFSVLRPEDAQRLGVKELLGQRVKIRTSGGRTLGLKLYRMAARVGDWRGLVTFGVPQGFDLDFNLLGRKEIFEHFAVCFHEAQGWVSLRPQRAVRSRPVR